MNRLKIKIDSFEVKVRGQSLDLIHNDNCLSMFINCDSCISWDFHVWRLCKLNITTVLNIRTIGLTREKWLGLVNSCVYRARQTPENLPGTISRSGFQSSPEALKSTE